MGLPEIISIVSLIVLWSGSLVMLWVKLNVKLAELDTKAESRYLEFREHVRWGEEMQKKNEHKFENIGNDIRENQKEMLLKLDNIQEKLNLLSIYVERNIVNKK